MLISDHYVDQNRILHKHGGYGVSGRHFVHVVRHLIQIHQCQTVLDYGCGKRTLSQGVLPLQPVIWQNYDPAIEGLDQEPRPADLVCCTDVLEHIEPECLDDVLDHLQELTLKVGFFTISLREGKRKLPDGRPAHLIVKPKDWWHHKLAGRWGVRECPMKGHENKYIVTVLPSSVCAGADGATLSSTIT